MPIDDALEKLSVDKLTAEEIVRRCNMCARPEYYSGRGAIFSDLDSGILEAVYVNIKNIYGNQAAKNYAQMIADIPKLSATDFLLTLYSLEGNKWEWNKRLLGNQNGIYIDGTTDEARIAVAFATIANGLYGINDRDEKGLIRGEFLMKHINEIKIKRRKNRSKSRLEDVLWNPHGRNDAA